MSNYWPNPEQSQRRVCLSDAEVHFDAPTRADKWVWNVYPGAVQPADDHAQTPPKPKPHLRRVRALNSDQCSKENKTCSNGTYTRKILRAAGCSLQH